MCVYGPLSGQVRTGDRAPRRAPGHGVGGGDDAGDCRFRDRVAWCRHRDPSRCSRRVRSRWGLRPCRLVRRPCSRAGLAVQPCAEYGRAALSIAQHRALPVYRAAKGCAVRCRATICAVFARPRAAGVRISRDPAAPAEPPAPRPPSARTPFSAPVSACSEGAGHLTSPRHDPLARIVAGGWMAACSSTRTGGDACPDESRPRRPSLPASGRTRADVPVAARAANQCDAMRGGRTQASDP